MVGGPTYGRVLLPLDYRGDKKCDTLVEVGWAGWQGMSAHLLQFLIRGYISTPHCTYKKTLDAFSA